MAPRGGGKLVEIETLVALGQLVVIQAAIVSIEEQLHLVIPQRLPGRGKQAHPLQEFQKLARLANALRGAFRVACAIEQHLPQHLAHMAAGLRVVADECDSLGRQALTANRQQAFAHIFGDPRVHTVRQNVIELTPRGADLAQVGHAQSEVIQGQIGGHAHSRCDRAGGEVDAHEAAGRERVGHGDEVAAIAAPNLQDAAARQRRRFHAEELAHRCQPVGMRLRPRKSGVGNQVVRIRGHGPIMACGWRHAADSPRHGRGCLAADRTPPLPDSFRRKWRASGGCAGPARTSRAACPSSRFPS